MEYKKGQPGVGCLFLSFGLYLPCPDGCVGVVAALLGVAVAEVVVGGGGSSLCLAIAVAVGRCGVAEVVG